MRLTRLAVALFALPWLVLPSLVLAQQRSPAVTKALDYLKANHERHLALQVSLAEVAAPTFHEGVRATRMAEEFRRVGLKDVAIDPQGNVLGWRPGASPDALVVAAHLDISFDTGVDTHVRKDGARWFGPGLSDDSRGLAAILAVAEALNDGAITTRRTLLFVANTGEEGLGDLNGVKYLFQKSPFRDRLKAFISVDGDAIEALVTGGSATRSACMAPAATATATSAVPTPFTRSDGSRTRWPASTCRRRPRPPTTLVGSAAARW
jgi:acetylornithine deacetylase/succinyl-diaminopimelate desuccinylase-like protein